MFQLSVAPEVRGATDAFTSNVAKVLENATTKFLLSQNSLLLLLLLEVTFYCGVDFVKLIMQLFYITIIN